MKGKNTKTKAVKKKVAVKSVKSKKVIKKSAPKAKALKRKPGKKENILGSVAQPKAETLGTKILVQEIKEEPKIMPLDVPVAEVEIIPQENIAVAQILPETDLNEEPIVADEPVDQPQYQDSAEEYYMQKELSPRQKNIIMYVSLTAIMGVLVIFWGLSIKNSMSQVVVDPGMESESEGLLNIFQGTFNDIKTEITDVANQNSVTDVKNQAFQEVKQQIVTDKVKDDIANQLKEKLENLNANIENTNNTNSNIK